MRCHFIPNILLYVRFIPDLYGRAKIYLNFQKFQITYLMFIFGLNYTPIATSAIMSYNFADIDDVSTNFANVYVTCTFF